MKVAIGWQAFGVAVAAARKQQRLSQTELAGVIGLSRNYLSFIEVGKANASYEIVAALCVYLNIKFPRICMRTDK